MQAFYPRRACADLRAAGADQRLGWKNRFAGGLGRIAGGGIDPRVHAAAVVAVETESAIHVDFRARPRPEDESGFRADECGGAVPDVFRSVALVHRKPKCIHARADRRAQPVAPVRAIFRVGAHARLLHVVAPHEVVPPPAFREVESVAKRVVAHLQAERALRVGLADPVEKHLARLQPGDEAFVRLLKLIAALRVVEEVGEVGKQIQIVVVAVGHHARDARLAAPVPLGREAVALAVPTVRRIDQPEAIDRARGDGAARDLVGGIPRRLVAHERRAPARAGVFLAVTQHAVALAVVVAALERPVVVHEFQSVEQAAGADLGGVGEQPAIIMKTPALDFREASGQRIGIPDVRRARAREIAVLRVVNALLVTDRADEFGDQKSRVGPALPVGVRDEVDGHAVHRRREIRAVIEVEAAQVILVGLPLAAVLRDDQSGHGLEDFAGADDRPRAELLLADMALGGGGRDADEIGLATLDHDRRELLGCGRFGCGRDGLGPQRRGVASEENKKCGARERGKTNGKSVHGNLSGWRATAATGPRAGCGKRLSRTRGEARTHPRLPPGRRRLRPPAAHAAARMAVLRAAHRATTSPAQRALFPATRVAKPPP